MLECKLRRDLIGIRDREITSLLIWHPLLFFLYLRHGFRSESEDVEANRVTVVSSMLIFNLHI